MGNTLRDLLWQFCDMKTHHSDNNIMAVLPVFVIEKFAKFQLGVRKKYK